MRIIFALLMAVLFSPIILIGVFCSTVYGFAVMGWNMGTAFELWLWED